MESKEIASIQTHTIEFKKLEAKRSELVFIGFSVDALKASKYSGNSVVVMPNRSIHKDTEKVTIYLDLSGVPMIEVLTGFAEQMKTRASQDEYDKLDEKTRAQIFKQGWWHIRIADWLVEKETATSKNALDKINALLSKLTPEESAILKSKLV